jgi:hypothetical protein
MSDPNSKRFAFFASHIGDYMHRWIFKHPWGTVRLHHILRSDDDRHLHDHPFNFVSLLLTGGYTEVTADGVDRQGEAVTCEKHIAARATATGSAAPYEECPDCLRARVEAAEARVKELEAAHERLFPIMDDDKGGRWSMPWRLIEPYNGQALRNHDQSLEKLASRGGLCSEEALAVIRGQRWRDRTPGHGRKELEDWVRGRIAEERAEEIASLQQQLATVFGVLREMDECRSHSYRWGPDGSSLPGPCCVEYPCEACQDRLAKLWEMAAECKIPTLAEQLATARNEALEEAARLVEGDARVSKERGDESTDDTTRLAMARSALHLQMAADGIRALKSPPAKGGSGG